jgi:prepilin-type N-terminal cleavage/methylation domain-containing protein
MHCAHKGGRASSWGFTLVELAVVLAIVSLLLGSLMYTLSAQNDQRNFEETRRRLEQARELVLAYALVNGQLPCPARSNSAGVEVRDAASRRCWDGTTEDYYGGPLTGGVVGGFLPASTIGFGQVDSSGFALDAWQNRIRYAVARTLAAGTCSPPIPPITLANPHWVNAINMKANGIACQPGDLLVCKSAAGITTSNPFTCGSAANQIMTQSLVVAIVYSTSKNGATTDPSRVDEAANLDGNPLFVYHTPAPSSATGGEFDDQFTWITVGELYGKLIAAGVLP